MIRFFVLFIIFVFFDKINIFFYVKRSRFPDGFACAGGTAFAAAGAKGGVGDGEVVFYLYGARGADRNTISAGCASDFADRIGTFSLGG